VKLLALFDKGIILRYTLECELLHEVDFVGTLEVAVLECLHGNWESCRKHQNLSIARQERDDLLDKWLEFGRQQFIGLGEVENKLEDTQPRPVCAS
jgi:hypothetical protein